MNQDEHVSNVTVEKCDNFASDDGKNMDTNVNTEENDGSTTLNTTKENDSRDNDDGDNDDIDADEDDSESYTPWFKYRRLFLVPSTAMATEDGRNHSTMMCTSSTMAKLNGMIPILVIGCSNGNMYLMNTLSKQMLASPESFRLDSDDRGLSSASNHNNGTAAATAVVGVSMDATGTMLGAIHSNNLCALWQIDQQENQQSNNHQSRPGDNARAPLRLQVQEQLLLDYDEASFGKATVLALDPAYTQRRHRRGRVVVGFDTGRLVLTKHAYNPDRQRIQFSLFPRRRRRKHRHHDQKQREDSILYQSSGGGGGARAREILSICWRGSTVAWADATGIRLMDMQTMTRIACIQRPTTAAVVGYHNRVTTTTMKQPCMLFETTDSLLVSWGKGVFSFQIRQQGQPARGTGGGYSVSTRTARRPDGDGDDDELGNASVSALSQSTPPSTLSTPHQCRRQPSRFTVECTMAWDFEDYVAGVAPLDPQHVVLLAVVDREDNDDDDDDKEGEEKDDALFSLSLPKLEHQQVQHERPAVVEMQVLDRLTGNIVHADQLPLTTPPMPQTLGNNNTHMGGRHPRRADVTSIPPMPLLQLSSNFALPRMDNTTELALEQQQQNDKAPTASWSLDQTSCSAFQDWHQRWNVKTALSLTRPFALGPEERNHPICRDSELMPDCDVSGIAMHDDSDDCCSVYSDEYDFVTKPPAQELFREQTRTSTRSSPTLHHPLFIIASSHDVVLARVQNVDDAIQDALEQNKAATALKLALGARDWLHRHDITTLMDTYFTSLLRMGNSDTVENEMEENHHEAMEEKSSREQPPSRPLSFRRMKLAVSALPAILSSSGGGNTASLREKWIVQLEQVPGSLFLLAPALPVQGSEVLNKRLYMHLVKRMLEQVNIMTLSSSTALDDESYLDEAIRRVAHALLSWGTLRVLEEHVEWYGEQNNVLLHSSFKESADRRREQSTGEQRSTVEPAGGPANAVTSRPFLVSALQLDMADTDERGDALYDVDDLLRALQELVPELVPLLNGGCDSQMTQHHSTHIAIPWDAFGVAHGVCPGEKHRRAQWFELALSSAAQLYMMKNRYEVALRCLLAIGSMHAYFSTNPSLTELEDAALASIYDSNNSDTKTSLATGQGRTDVSPYAFVVSLIESHQLHENLMDSHFLHQDLGSPVLALLFRLVGLDLLGDFLVKHCVAPGQHKRPPHRGCVNSSTQLPLDLVAHRLEDRPKLLLWYLHLVFVYAREAYIPSADTANPPAVLSKLYHRHIELHIQYSNERHRDSVRVLQGIPATRVEETTTPLLALLKVVLEVGLISPSVVRKLLENEQREESGKREEGVSASSSLNSTFALELAYLVQYYGDDDESDARLVLQLYLEGARSLMLAVTFAQHADKEYASQLWDIIIQHCLQTSLDEQQMPAAPTIRANGYGSQFGDLLEASALTGAPNLARLVSLIPRGMAIQGLRSCLLTAIADYRWMLEMQKRLSKVAREEKTILFRERKTCSRRGCRQVAPSDMAQRKQWDISRNTKATAITASIPITPDDFHILSSSVRPKMRSNHNSGALAREFRGNFRSLAT